MPSEDNRAAPNKLEEQFYEKIKYNFKLHVLLCLKGSNCNRHSVLQKIYLLEGYRCHKAAKYGTNWSHLHVKFIEEEQAKAAVDFFKAEDAGLTAVLVDDLLRDWHSFEKRSNHSPPWTLAVVDVVGSTPRLLNFLAPRILNGILEDFGRPFLLPYTAALAETHVQVLFSSMTEALAACMAFGQWFRTGRKTDQFFYRVRISPSSKEALLIRISGGIPEEAFKLDYFLNERRIHQPSAGHARGSNADPKFDKGAFHGRCHPKAAEVGKKYVKAAEVGKTRKSSDDARSTKHHIAVKSIKSCYVTKAAKPREAVKDIEPCDSVVRLDANRVESTKIWEDDENHWCRGGGSRVRFLPSPVVCVPVLTAPGVMALATMDSLHTAVFPRGFGAAFRSGSRKTLIGEVDAPGMEVAEARAVFDRLHEVGSASDVGFLTSFQQTTTQTMPSNTVPDNNVGQVVKAFERSEILSLNDF